MTKETRFRIALALVICLVAVLELWILQDYLFAFIGFAFAAYLLLYRPRGD